MSRKLTQASLQRIFTQRADNYAHHFECWTEVKTMSGEFRDLIAHAASHLRMPFLTIFGSTFYTRDDHLVLIVLAKQIGMEDPFLINPWYTSEAGWQAFQDAWKNMPDPVDFVPRWVGTKREVVPFCTHV
jgi:hypothetical protein